MGTNNRLSGGPEKAEAPKMSDGDARNKDLDAEPEKEKRTLASDDYTQKQKIGVCVMYAATSIAISMCYKVRPDQSHCRNAQLVRFTCGFFCPLLCADRIEHISL